MSLHMTIEKILKISWSEWASTSTQTHTHTIYPKFLNLKQLSSIKQRIENVTEVQSASDLDTSIMTMLYS